jgi:hypothetical protein
MAIELSNPLTRETVSGWLDEWKEMDPQPDIRVFLTDKVNNLLIPDTMVDTRALDSYEDETPLVQMLIDDLPSYGITDY